MAYSDFVIYADESGDHGLASIDPGYPVFVLAFCIMGKRDYTDAIVPAVQRFKFQFFGHDLVILHGHEIRKKRGDFACLLDARRRQDFMEGLNGVVEGAPFTIVAAVIDKQKLTRQYVTPDNPYEIALCFCMERAFAYLQSNGQAQLDTHIVVERRGKKEDDQLELVFRRIAQGANQWGPMPFEIRFADKQCNSTGLQVADLIAHPIGRHIINPNQTNRAFELIEPKFRRSPDGRMSGWGLKVFP